MAVRDILKLGDTALRERAKEVNEFDERLWMLLDDMKETMMMAQGAGLAAPQVGILKRVIVVTVDEGATIYEVINPVIVKKSGVQRRVEGCLSIPGRSGIVERPKKLSVEGKNRRGEPVKIKADGFLATAFCHEIDHLDGVLYIDKIIKEDEPK